MRLKTCLQIVLLSLLGVSAAQADGAVQSRLDAYRIETQADGKEKTIPGASALPGSIVEYRLVYDNTGKAPVSGLVVNAPVPQEAQFVAGSASSAVKHTLRYSADGGTTWALPPLTRQVKTADGQTVAQTVPPEQYTHAQWTVLEPLKAGVAQEFRYRVRVRGDSPTNAKAAAKS